MNGISVIVCCYNASKRIAPVLRHLALQKCTLDAEVIIVDNSSEDGTANVAAEEWSKYKSRISFRIITEVRKGKTFAFEKGVNESRFKYIVICDDDNWLTENYLQTGYEIMENNDKIGALGGEGLPEFESEAPEWFNTLLKNGYATGPQGEASGDISIKGWVYGAGMILRKDAYLRLKSAGFANLLTGHKGNELLSGEDSEICYALIISGYKIWYDERLKFYHFTERHRTDWHYALKINKGYGAANIILTCYKLAVTKNLKLFSHLLWYTEVLRLMKIVLSDFSTYYYIFNKTGVNIKNLMAAKRLGELSFFLSNKSLFERNQQAVISLCNYFGFFIMENQKLLSEKDRK